jgi:hypothetical protein
MANRVEGSMRAIVDDISSSDESADERDSLAAAEKDADDVDDGDVFIDLGALGSTLRDIAPCFTMPAAARADCPRRRGLEKACPPKERAAIQDRIRAMIGNHQKQAAAAVGGSDNEVGLRALGPGKPGWGEMMAREQEASGQECASDVSSGLVGHPDGDISPDAFDVQSSGPRRPIDRPTENERLNEVLYAAYADLVSRYAANPLEGPQ